MLPSKSNTKDLNVEILSIDEDDIIPGTIHLIDIDNSLNLQQDGSKKHIILQPQPSSNPNDPLRWSQKKKNAQFLLLFVWSFLLAVSLSWTSPYREEWTIEFDSSLLQLNVPFSLAFLFLGVGCVILQPTAMKLGRRFVFLLCTIIVMVANIVGSQANSIKYIYVWNILVGFSGAPVDSLVEICSTDVFFIHERASKLSWLIMALYLGTDLGPVISGYIPTWKDCYFILIAIFAVLFVILLFTLEDTTFSRREHFSDKGLLEKLTSNEANKNTISNIEPNEGKLLSIMDNNECGIDMRIPKRTYWQKMRLFETENTDKRSWITIFYKPIELVTFPAILWSGTIYGAQMMWLSLVNQTLAEVFTTYYGFSTSSVGLTNLSALIGSIIGMFYGGAFVDWFSIKLARRNKGILEAEFRLWAMIVPTILNAAGLLAYGLGAANNQPWALPVVLGQGFLGFAMSSSGPICLTYAIDSYPKLASESLVLILFVRNLIGCAFTFAIQPWLNRDGLSLTTWLMFMLSLVINGSFIGMIFWGKKFRKWTKRKYYKISGHGYGEVTHE